jgi:hypothetical protein
MKKKAPGRKLVLSRETLTALDPSLMAAAGGGSGNTCVTCTSMTSAASACHARDTTPLCE